MKREKSTRNRLWSLAAWLVMAAVLTLYAALATAHPAAFTIDQVMQAPFPSSLVAAPRGKAVAWVFDARGSRNLWCANAAHGMKARALTSFTGDDGYNLGELAWSQDSQLLAFTRAQTLEDDRPANVASSPQGATSREVWVVSTAGGDAHKVGAGHAPAFSPDGSRLVFIDKDRIWTVSPTGSEPQPLVIDGGQIASLTFSTDGRRLAFVSARSRHALIGVYDFASQRIVWMAASLDQDSSPVFSPTGSQVAFIRVPSQSAPEFLSRRSGEPWSIWVADAASGQAKRVWKAEGGAGSVFHPTLSDANLLWTRSGTLVFPWEKTGWLQLYSIPATGGAAVPLTSGSFEIANLAISPDRARIVYSSNQADEDRLHVWLIDEHKSPVRLGGDGNGIEDAPQVAADGTMFALRGGATEQLEPAMLSAALANACARNRARVVSPKSARYARERDLQGQRRPDRSWATFRAAGWRDCQPTSCGTFLSRRPAPPDAARLPPHGCLQLDVCAQSVLRGGGLHRPVGQLPRRHRLRARLPRGEGLRPRRRE